LKPAATAAAGGTTSKKDRTRRRILDAAAKVLARQGIEQATLTDIAAAAELKAGSLYFHFASREELLGEELNVGVAESWAHLTRAIEASAGRSPGAQLRAAIGAHVEARHELTDYAAVVIGAAHTHPRLGDELYQRHYRRYTARWLELIVAAQAHGALPSGADPRLLRDLCFGAMNVAPRGRWSSTQTSSALVSLLHLSSEESS
jgi:AcrR family transcriptional regulator